MDDVIDLLKIKIEKAKRELPENTQNAIAAVDWRAAVLSLRSRYGYTFEQLGDLELETELLLCGLVSPENYPKELENRMKISKAATNELVNEMNNLVFKKIREELVKNMEKEKKFAVPLKPLSKDIVAERVILQKDGIEILDKPDPNVSIPTADIPLNVIGKLPVPEKLELEGEAVHPILAEKLSGSVQIPIAKTEHSLENITKAGIPNPLNTIPQKPKLDPYREVPE